MFTIQSEHELRLSGFKMEESNGEDNKLRDQATSSNLRAESKEGLYMNYNLSSTSDLMNRMNIYTPTQYSYFTKTMKISSYRFTHTHTPNKRYQWQTNLSIAWNDLEFWKYYNNIWIELSNRGE